MVSIKRQSILCWTLLKSSCKCMPLSNSFTFRNAQLSSSSRGPLDGVVICDMTRILAGPYCTMVLGDMGTEVIKIERPHVGDETRTWGPPFIHGESCYYMSINRNKKSISVDIHQNSGKEIIYDIVKKSDVFIENFIPGKLDSLGFGYEELSRLNPLLIYCSISGYGCRGPDKMKPGYDLVASAVGGLLHVTGPQGGGPCRAGVAVTDILTGMYAHSAILSALYERSSTNKGKRIDVSLLQSQVAMMSHHAANYLNKQIEPTRLGSRNSCIVPSGTFNTADGELVISATTSEIFGKLCASMKQDGLSTDNRFKTNSDRVMNRNILEELIGGCIAQQPTEYWVHMFDEAGVPCSRVNNMMEVFDSPQVSALNSIVEITHPVCGEVVVTPPAVTYDNEQFLSPPLHPPLLGEHTENNSHGG